MSDPDRLELEPWQDRLLDSLLGTDTAVLARALIAPRTPRPVALEPEERLAEARGVWPSDWPTWEARDE